VAARTVVCRHTFVGTYGICNASSVDVAWPSRPPSETGSVSTAIPGDRHDRLVRLRRFLALLIPFFIGIGVIQFVVYIVYGASSSAVAAALALGYAAVLLAALRALRAHALGRAVLLIAGGLIAFGVLYALFVPTAAAAVLVVPILAVAIALPYLDRDRLRAVIIGAWIAAVVTVAMLEIAPTTTVAPPWLVSALRIGQLGAAVALVMYLLWEYSSRLKAALAEEAAANAASREAQETVKRVNRELRRRVQELERRNREATLVGHMGSLLEVSRTSQEAYEVIERASRTLFPGTAGAVLTVPEPRLIVEATARWGNPPPKSQVFAPEDCWALRQGRLHLVESPDFGPRCGHVASDPIRPYVCIPLTAQGVTLGVFHVAATSRAAGPEGKLDEDLRQLAMWVAELLALSLANYRLRETLHVQSTRDSLTGLYNRRYMEETLEREIYRAAREDSSLGVIMADLDHFKAYNDRFGHAAGDALLRTIGQGLRDNVRAEDIACRYGGEEFTMILPNATKEDTRRRAEVLRAEARGLQGSSMLEAAVTLSLGVAAFPEDGSDASEVVGAADAALYRAKAAGRDRVEVAVQQALA
jgi:diguanylate cyclase (GGDEF)-like protein